MRYGLRWAVSRKALRVVCFDGEYYFHNGVLDWSTRVYGAWGFVRGVKGETMWCFKPARLLAGALLMVAIGCSDRDDNTKPPPTPPKTPPPAPTARIDRIVIVNLETQSHQERSMS